nr:MAG TPA: hypothetical protein [Caudoviricetes sp.]
MGGRDPRPVERGPVRPVRRHAVGMAEPRRPTGLGHRRGDAHTRIRGT